MSSCLLGDAMLLETRLWSKPPCVLGKNLLTWSMQCSKSNWFNFPDFISKFNAALRLYSGPLSPLPQPMMPMYMPTTALTLHSLKASHLHPGPPEVLLWHSPDHVDDEVSITVDLVAKHPRWRLQHLPNTCSKTHKWLSPQLEPNHNRWYLLRFQKTLTTVTNCTNIKQSHSQYQQSIESILAQSTGRFDSTVSVFWTPSKLCLHHMPHVSRLPHLNPATYKHHRCTQNCTVQYWAHKSGTERVYWVQLEYCARQNRIRTTNSNRQHHIAQIV